jgi:peptide/nickel transport system substrate-binding protein
VAVHSEKRTRRPAWLGALTLAVGLAACRGGDAQESAAPLEVVVSTDVETLDPRHATDAVSMRVTRLLHAGLSRLDPDTLEPRPYLARAWTWEDPVTLRVELREDVRFHGGKALEPEDVIATVAAFRSPTVGSRHARVVEPIERVEADGPHAVRIRLRRLHATLLSDLELPILRADEAAGPPRPHGLDGLGPYALASFARGTVELVPADGGALPRPAHAVRVRTVHDENARALRLVAGRTDVALNVVSPSLLPALEREGLRVASRPGANLTYVVLRTDRGPTADPDVRRAIAQSLDRQTVVDALLGGRGRVASSLLPPGHWAHADAAPFPFDRDGARARLGGRTVHLTWLTSTDRLRVQIARYLAQEAAAAGLYVEVVPLELGTMIARLNAGDFDCASLQLPELAEPNVLRVFLHSESVPPAGANRGRVRDRSLDAALDAGALANDVARRREAYAILEAIVRREAYVIPLWHEDQVVVTSARAAGFEPSAEGRWLGLAALP